MKAAFHLPLRRSVLPTTSSTTTFVCTQCRHATLLRRPKRPYTFTQLIALSDGSTFTHRTTSPQPIYRSTRDTRNALLWNPSSEALQNVEDDEAGRLAAFRHRFGRGWDSSHTVTAEAERRAAAGEATTPAGKDGKTAAAAQEEYYEEDDEDDNLLDLISAFGQAEAEPKPKGGKNGKK